MRRFLMIVLCLASCTLTAPKPADGPTDGSAAPVGLTGAAPIEVTPLDGPAPAAAQTPAPGAAPAAASPSPVAPDTVQQATPATPHPKARPDAGATPEAASDVPEVTPDPAATPEAAKSEAQVLCEAANGIWGQAGESGAFTCQKRTNDGGKVCHKKADCSGECLAKSGTCSPVAPLFGCNDVLDKEGRAVTLCID